MQWKINLKIQFKMDNKKSKELPKSFEAILENGERKDVLIHTWNERIIDRNEIESFTTLVGDKLYHVTPNKNEVFLPYSEYHGDHAMNWIIAVDVRNNKEVFRKNLRLVDMVNWKLSSSSTNKNNGNAKK